MLKGNKKYPRNITSIYDTLKRFKLEAPRNNNTGGTGDRGNIKNHGGRGVRDHILIQHNAPSGTIFTP